MQPMWINSLEGTDGPQMNIPTIMTEDDTFRILRRPSYLEMRRIWASSELIGTFSSMPYAEYQAAINEFFNSYGWDVKEYSKYSDNAYTGLNS